MSQKLNKVALKRIAIISCWYGAYPWYFSYFINSCKHNPTIDFFIITDNRQPIPKKPVNVKVIYKTLEEIKTTAYSDRLSVQADIITENLNLLQRIFYNLRKNISR